MKHQSKGRRRLRISRLSAISVIRSWAQRDIQLVGSIGRMREKKLLHTALSGDLMRELSYMTAFFFKDRQLMWVGDFCFFSFDLLEKKKRTTNGAPASSSRQAAGNQRAGQQQTAAIN